MGGRPLHRWARAEQWFWPRVDRSGGPDACWPWTGRLDKGYGRITVDGKKERVHRVAFKLTHGDPQGLVCHKCGNKPCCNPAHLYDGTPLTNTEDRRAAGVSTTRSGPDNHQARLTREAVAAIRSSAERSSVLAARFKVSRRTIWLIRSGRRWKEATNG